MYYVIGWWTVYVTESKKIAKRQARRMNASIGFCPRQDILQPRRFKREFGAMNCYDMDAQSFFKVRETEKASVWTQLLNSYHYSACL